MKLLRMFVAVLLVAAPTLSYGQGVPFTQIPQGRAAVVYTQLPDGTYAPVSATDPVPISGSISATNPSVGTNTSAAPASSTQIGWKDGSGNLQAASAAQPVPVADAAVAAAMASEVPAGDELIGGVDIRASTLGGLTKFTLTAANSTNATSIKASAGKLYHITGYNNSATLAWISFYNNAGTPTCGTNIVWQTMIPANSTSGSGAIDDIPAGLDFSTGIAMCVTTGIAGTGSVAASTYVVNLGYK
jgi:hypothetical protein